MKRTILSLAFALLSATSMLAAKAQPGICQVQLADGSIVSASRHGDENFYYYITTDGTPIRLNDNGKYEKTTIGELKAQYSAAQQARQIRANLVNQAYQANLASRASGINAKNRYFPHTGSPKALVILVEFKDLKFKSSNPVATFNHYLNAEMGAAAPEADAAVYSQKPRFNNYGSVREYFKFCSEGKFAPQFDVVGPVTMSQESAFYGKNRNSGKIDLGNDQMLGEACSRIDKDVDFAQYDSDGDGYVDLVYVIYAGYSESISGNDDNCLWPKSGTTTFYRYDKNGIRGDALVCDGKRFSRYGINNELNGTPADTENGIYQINGIGLFCHEFSHTMGLPDHYPTEYPATYADNQSPEYWDLMDAGEYTYDGYRPTPYSPWEKMLMGWVDPITLSPTEAGQLTLEPYDVASKAYKIEADVNDDNFFFNPNSDYSSGDVSELVKDNLKKRAKGEFLLLQNIRNEGWYKYLHGYGMLVWRIDYADKSTVSLGDFPNDEKGISRVMVVPADGLVINQANCGDGKDYKYSWDEYTLSLQNDPFPAYKIGEDGKDINSLTQVKFNWSTLSTRPLYNIKKDESTGMVTFDYLKDFATDAAVEGITMAEDNQPAKYFDLEGRSVQTPKKGHLYVTNKGKKVVF